MIKAIILAASILFPSSFASVVVIVLDDQFYVIPVDCVPVELDKPRAIYLDDGGVAPEDPNGVQDFAIVLGLTKHIDALAVATTSQYTGSVELIQQIVDRYDNPMMLLDHDAVIDFIIEKAWEHECFLSPLYILIGGEWNALSRSLMKDPEIAEYLFVIGIGGSNIGGGSKRRAYDHIVSTLTPSKIITIDDKPTNPNFRQAYNATLRWDVSRLKGFYSSNLKPVLRGIKDSDGTDVTDSSKFYRSFARTLNLNQGEGMNGDAAELRIADFLTIAYLIWKSNDVFDKDFMYPKIEDGLKDF